MGRSSSNIRLMGRVIIATLLALGGLFTSASTNAPGWVDDGDCADCHADISETFPNTSHGTYLRGSAAPDNGACQSCHGPGGAHVDSEDPADIINPLKLDVISGESTCLACHADHVREDWMMSDHRIAGVQCADCHQVHAVKDVNNYKRPTERCYECHSEVKAASFMPSRHPIAEGKMECSDCHNVHGGSNEFEMNGTARESCLNCHAQQEGPFVFEHPPVNEDCLICHTPHGSVADFLLKQAEPSLCLSCHSMHFHAGVEGVDGEFSTPNDPDRAGVSTPDAWKKVMLTKCTQCHSEIHGSDLPSQSISGQGKALTR
jgi:DmsE family decaheme c-type cytochrome